MTANLVLGLSSIVRLLRFSLSLSSSCSSRYIVLRSSSVMTLEGVRINFALLGSRLLRSLSRKCSKRAFFCWRRILALASIARKWFCILNAAKTSFLPSNIAMARTAFLACQERNFFCIMMAERSILSSSVRAAKICSRRRCAIIASRRCLYFLIKSFALPRSLFAVPIMGAKYFAHRSEVRTVFRRRLKTIGLRTANLPTRTAYCLIFGLMTVSIVFLKRN
mmetsp:Transcript_15949/g.21882  ORF Transcript_15949/g.21882 Transcript_15949/m.21882 type:complete len:222 (-) Transcript_15949:788-1453(-)